MQTGNAIGNSINVIGLFFCSNLYFIMVFGSDTFSILIFRDNGAISILTVCCILLAQLFVIYEVVTASKLINKFDWLSLAFILQVYVMREADFHRTFTSENVTRSAFYTNPDNPLIAKLIAAVVTVICLLAITYLAIKYASRCLKALRHGNAWAVSALIWFTLLLLSQIFDKSSLNDSPDLRIKNIEEMLEFSSALYLVIGAVLFRFGKSDLNRQAASASAI